jgi:integrase
MTISIRERKASKGKSRLYLDYFHNGRRKSETLDLYIFDKPQSKLEREANKTSRQYAEAIKSTRFVEFQNGKYRFANTFKQQGSFLDYFKKLTEDRKRSSGNYGNWLSTYQILLKFVNGGGLTFEEADADFLERFKKYLLEAKITKSNTKLSRNSALSYFNKVKAALNQAFDEKIKDDKVSLRVKGIKEEETHREFLTLDELQKLINKPCEVDILKRAFLFSAFTGLRWSDVNNLTWKNIEYSNELKCHQIRYVQKKTKAAEVLPISDQALAFLDERSLDSDRVFKGLKYSAWNNLKLQQWVMQAGISKTVTFHCARHTFATLMLTHNVDIFTVSKLLGHKDIKTTQIYAKVIDKRKVDAINLFPKFELI